LPCNYFEIIKNCKYFNFYYNEEERNNYLASWTNKISEPFIPFSKDEYIFYVNLYLDNQYINNIQLEHYIDNGCFCNYCSNKRKDIFIRAKNGETKFEKIIHNNTLIRELELKKNINKIIINKAKIELNKKQLNKKYNSSLFIINKI
jgi:hypothetical protein